MTYQEGVRKAARKIEGADAIMVGVGAGLSAAGGLFYSGERFERNFGDFAEKYGISDMYSGGFYPFPTPEEFWAWWSRHIYINRYEPDATRPYQDLADILRGRNYFVLTTNVDHQLQKAGIDKSRLFYTQGDYGLFQCSVPCTQETYDNEESIRAMYKAQQGMRVPSSMLPVCPRCGAPMTTNLRADERFAEDEGWHKAAGRYEAFLDANEDTREVFVEIGVGDNTPGIIKYPFWRMCMRNPRSYYIAINDKDSAVPRDLLGRALGLRVDAARALSDIRSALEEGDPSENGQKSRQKGQFGAE